MTVAAAVLAAGEGTRLAGTTPKPLVELRGKPLITWALDAVRESGLRPLLLAVGAHADEVAQAAGDDVRVVHAQEWQSGIAHSLRAVLDALESEASVDAVCVGLADQPQIGSEAYRRLAAAHEQHDTPMVVATYEGERGNPVLLGRSVWARARELEGDVGARALMKDTPVLEVDCTGTGDPRDVDTLEDLRALERDGEAPE